MLTIRIYRQSELRPKYPSYITVLEIERPPDTWHVRLTNPLHVDWWSEALSPLARGMRVRHLLALLRLVTVEHGRAEPEVWVPAFTPEMLASLFDEDVEPLPR